jgi:hypothetical protein
VLASHASRVLGLVFARQSRNISVFLVAHWLVHHTAYPSATTFPSQQPKLSLQASAFPIATKPAYECMQAATAC